MHKKEEMHVQQYHCIVNMPSYEHNHPCTKNNLTNFCLFYESYSYKTIPFSYATSAIKIELLCFIYKNNKIILSLFLHL